jgi:dTDP-4-amino-4,6-dideoxygalactose transaminase
VSSGEGGALLTNRRDIFEPALIYQDSSAIAFFGNQMDGFSTEPFCGVEFRANELCAAVMNRQLDRLDGILADLRRNKKYMMEKLLKLLLLNMIFLICISAKIKHLLSLSQQEKRIRIISSISWKV